MRIPAYLECVSTHPAIIRETIRFGVRPHQRGHAPGHAKCELEDMADQRLKNCSVLVVDDSAPSRTLVANTLQDVGVGVVNTVPHGAAAIAHLEHSALSSMNGPTPPVDLVITEWEMEPVGGMMLLNWLRRAVSSPDRFTRTVIMSGALDLEKVELARACGVNAVFTKPFTINSLTKHVMTVLDSNPAYFKTPTYFGPDRRRRDLDAVLDERRAIDGAYDEVLGAGEHPEIGCFQLPNYLEAALDGAPRELIDYHLRHDAHELLAAHSEDYADWIERDVARLRRAFDTANATPLMRLRNLATMHGVVLRLEREGDHMGYPLVSALAHTLKNALNVDVRLWRETAKIFQAAIRGLEAVVREHIGGHGGAMGAAVAASLGEMDQKLLRLAPVHARRQGLNYYKGRLPG